MIIIGQDGLQIIKSEVCGESDETSFTVIRCTHSPAAGVLVTSRRDVDGGLGSRNEAADWDVGSSLQ